MKNAPWRIILFFATVSLILCTYPTIASASQPTIHRIAGWTQYDTAVEIAKEGWPNGSNYAIVAYGEKFPDALAATPLATKYNAPILLTEKQRLTAATKNELAALGVKNVILVGGPGAISEATEAQIKALGISTSRLYGYDQYDTSVAIASNVGSSNKVLIVASGDDFANALSVSSYAGMNNLPIVLVNKNKLNDSHRQFLSSNSFQKTYIIGNANEISDQVMNQFPNPTRIQGSNKYDTNLAVLKAFDSSYNFDKTFVTTGNGFADALAGSAYAAKIKAPVILLGSTKNSDTDNYLKSKSSVINQINVLGGEIALPPELIQSYLPLNKSYSANEISKIVSPSIVYIETYNYMGYPIAGGSGFIVDSKGTIATNYHIIADANTIKVKTYDGQIYDASKIDISLSEKDLAFVMIDATGLPAVTLGDSDLIETGDKIYTLGNPYGLENTMSDGIISNASRIEDGIPLIQISAPISYGSSGGALINEQAEVIGITSAGYNEGQNLNFAIPINLIKPLLNSTNSISLPIKEASNTTPPPKKNPIEEELYVKIEDFLQEHYSINTIADFTVEYNFSVERYSGNSDGEYEGNPFIIIEATADTVLAEYIAILADPEAYFTWCSELLDNLQLNFGSYGYCGIICILEEPVFIFDNWSGDWYVDSIEFD